MRCTSCENENRAGRKFCAACGAALRLACAACGFANDVDDRFCGGCGRTLAAGPEQPARPASPPSAERRPVTVLFCDLVGYTSLSARLDPEEIGAILERYFETVDAIVDRFGGTVDKHIGDAVMALFGAPVAHGNDAERAVRAAGEIQAAVPALGDELAVPLAVHIGLATGEVVTSALGSAIHRGYTVTGEAANVAARLLEVAGSGETVASGEVRMATEAVAAFEPLGAMALKGLAGPVAAWRLREIKNAARPSTALVGRRSELAQVRALCEECLAGGTGAMVLVRGEAGIGKSRLVEEIRSLAASLGWHEARGAVLDFGTARGHGAVRTMLLGILELEGSVHSNSSDAVLELLQPRWTLTNEEELALLDLLELPIPEPRLGLYQATDAAARMDRKAALAARLVQESARVRPLLVTVEDVHWADRNTLVVLAALGRGTVGSPAIVLMTTRPEGDPLDAEWRAGTDRASLATIDLMALSHTDSMALARQLSASADMAEACVHRSGGNPLFLEQLLRSAADLTDQALPASIRSVVLARTDLLPQADRQALQTASVFGQRVSLQYLRALLDDPAYDPSELVRHALLRPVPDGLQFAHALVRDGVYGSLTHARRRSLHRAAADLFASDAILRAEHLGLAQDPGASLAYLAAARLQASMFRLDEADTLAGQGLALARVDADIHALAMLLGDLRRDAGRGPDALGCYKKALGAASTEAGRCRALLGIAACHRLTSAVDEAFDVLAQAEPIAAREDGSAAAELHYLRGCLYFARGRADESRAEHVLALDHARHAEDPEWTARALSGLADASYMDGRMITALRHFSECVALCELNGLTRIVGPNRTMMGHCRTYLCELEEGVRDMQAALTLARQTGNLHQEMFNLQSIGFCLTMAGRYVEAQDPAVHALELARRLNARRYEAGILAHSGEIALALGHRQDALRMLRLGCTIAEETGQAFCGPMLLSLLALVADTTGEQEFALARGEAILASGAVSHCHVWYRRCVIERALLRGSWAEAERQAGLLESWAADEPLPYASLLAERAVLLARIGAGTADERDTAALDSLSERATLAGLRPSALGEALRGAY